MSLIRTRWLRVAWTSEPLEERLICFNLLIARLQINLLYQLSGIVPFIIGRPSIFGTQNLTYLLITFFLS